MKVLKVQSYCTWILKKRIFFVFSIRCFMYCLIYHFIYRLIYFLIYCFIYCFLYCVIYYFMYCLMYYLMYCLIYCFIFCHISYSAFLSFCILNIMYFAFDIFSVSCLELKPYLKSWGDVDYVSNSRSCLESYLDFKSCFATSHLYDNTVEQLWYI